jgi:hypothetical protein
MLCTLAFVNVVIMRMELAASELAEVKAFGVTKILECCTEVCINIKTIKFFK